MGDLTSLVIEISYGTLFLPGFGVPFFKTHTHAQTHAENNTQTKNTHENNTHTFDGMPDASAVWL